MGEYKDQEIVEMLLFKLPWLCHGVKLDLSGKHGKNASMTDELSSQQSVSNRSATSLDAEINERIRAAKEFKVGKDTETNPKARDLVKSSNPFTQAQL